MPRAPLAETEAAYLAAREARDAALVARATGDPVDLDALEAAAAEASAAANDRLVAAEADQGGLDDEDHHALAVMREGLEEADGWRASLDRPDARLPGDPEAWARLVRQGGRPLRDALDAAFAATGAALPAPGGPASRISVLARLAAEPDERDRRAWFLALEPLWRLVNGDDDERSAYRRLMQDAAPAWRAGTGPLARNAEALGIRREHVQTWARTALSAWRAAVVEPARARGAAAIEPWDWWWRAGEAERLVGELPSNVIRELAAQVHRAHGADLEALGVRVDSVARPGRPPVSSAYAAFASRPRRLADGTWTRGRSVLLATLEDGGLDELNELMHMTGHAIHIAGIRTRPAFADLPDSDALTEGLADLLAFDVAEPAWQRHWLPGGRSAPEDVSLRCHYASIVLDAAWALFELRMLENPEQHPNELWAELTSVWLGIAPHPEWSWWAIRGQLAREPGYMANYPLGVVLTTELRAAIREARGEHPGGDPGWYAWVADALYRFGRETSSGRVVRDVLGRAPTADALLTEIARAARPPEVR